MTERIPKGFIIAALVLGLAVLAYFCYSAPGYFVSQTYLGGILGLECLVVAVWLYRRVFFPIVIVTFLLAGVNLPVGTVWTSARWMVLAAGALVGAVLVLKEHGFQFGLFHVIALFAVLAALGSAAVSLYTTLSLLKVLSLFLLFIYAATGARVAVRGRESRFFSGLLLGAEIFVAVIGLLYLAGIQAMGNPNSLGAVMGVVASPILLWGLMVDESKFVHRRRLVFFALALYLTFASHARASMAAAFVSCGLLCLALRKYKLLIQGIGIIVIVVAASAIANPEAFSRMASSLTSTVVYKGKDPAHGVMSSRESPWRDAIDTIQNHFWFGTGFGTADNGQDVTDDLGKFSSTTLTSAERGSSYLSIISWVGVLGVLPFLALPLLLLKKTLDTVVWMRRTGNPTHPAIPLAMVIVAGTIHAGLEDWMFAPGYYLCVFFWSIAFVFVDYAPSRATAVADSRLPFFSRSRFQQQNLGDVAPVR